MTGEMKTAKSCSTCEHRCGIGHFKKCDLSGTYCQVERKYPTRCGFDYAGWSPRRGVVQRVRDWLYGVTQ